MATVGALPRASARTLFADPRWAVRAVDWPPAPSSPELLVLFDGGRALLHSLNRKLGVSKASGQPSAEPPEEITG